MGLFTRFGRTSTGLLFVMALISFSLTANDVKLNNNSNDIRITENTGQGFTIVFSFSEFRSLDVKTPKGIFSRILVSSFARSGEFGCPELPVRSELIEIPVNAEARVRIIDFDVKEYRLKDLGIDYPLMPNQPPVPKTGEPVEFIYQKSAYKVNAFSSVEIASVEPLGTMRGVNIGRLDILPVQYNPVTGMIRVYENLEIEVTFENADLAATELNKQVYGNHYFAPVFNSLVNYRQTGNGSRENFSRYPIKYVIVADRMPCFPGSDTAMSRFIAENLQYPAEAKENDINGEVQLSFTVNKNGRIENINVTESLGYGCDEEAVRLIGRMPDWLPALKNGKPVKEEVVLSIEFKQPLD